MDQKKIFITGATGFVGNYLVQKFLENGYQVIAVGSRSTWTAFFHPNLTYISADTTQSGRWQEVLKDVDVAINLAGRTIFHYWTNAYKQQIYNSRILTTQNLVHALPEGKQTILISASAAGFYGSCGDDLLTELAPGGTDFLARVCKDWEYEAIKAEKKHTRVVLTRFGVVLGKNGGALAKMIPAFRLGLGGPIGNGKQWFPWIHMDDLVSAVQFAMDHPSISGPVNLCAPGLIRQKDFAHILGKILNRPALLPVPKLLLKLILQEFASALLSSQKVYPAKLIENGFQFKYPEIEQALRHIVHD